VELRTKKQAAEFLGVSTRGIERAVRRGHLQALYRPGKHGLAAWFASDDLESFRDLQHARMPLGFAVKPPVDTGFTIGTIRPLPPPEGETGGRSPSPRRRTVNDVPITQRLTLNIEDAASLSGLPRQFLVANVQSGKLKAIKVGRSWFVKRTDLDAFVSEL
jgi:excisionase family DNA binding protein